MRRVLIACALLAFAACNSAERRRVVAEQVAKDTVAAVWHHTVGVDSVLPRGDTTVVWISPTNWMATDAPQAGVRVGPAGRVLAIQWIFGG
jgi:hypothetical protein